MSTREDLIREIEAFLQDTRMAPTVFGQKAMKDRALMISLRAGRDLKLATVDKIRAFMASERKKRAKGVPPKSARQLRAEAEAPKAA